MSELAQMNYLHRVTEKLLTKDHFDDCCCLECNKVPESKLYLPTPKFHQCNWLIGNVKGNSQKILFIPYETCFEVMLSDKCIKSSEGDSDSKGCSAEVFYIGTNPNDKSLIKISSNDECFKGLIESTNALLNERNAFQTGIPNNLPAVSNNSFTKGNSLTSPVRDLLENTQLNEELSKNEHLSIEPIGETDLINPLKLTDDSEILSICKKIISYFDYNYRKRDFFSNCYCNSDLTVINIFTSIFNKSEYSFFRTRIVFNSQPVNDDNEKRQWQLQGFLEVMFESYDDTYSGTFQHRMPIPIKKTNRIEQFLNEVTNEFRNQLNECSVKCKDNVKQIRRILPVTKTKLNWHRAMLSEQTQTIQ